MADDEIGCCGSAKGVRWGVTTVGSIKRSADSARSVSEGELETSDCADDSDKRIPPIRDIRVIRGSMLLVLARIYGLGLAEQSSYCGGDAFGDLSHALVIQSLGQIGGHVVIGIAEKTGVGEHECRVALVPE